MYCAHLSCLNNKMFYFVKKLIYTTHYIDFSLAYSDVIYLDFRKAFDCFPHLKLLERLDQL